MKSTLLVIQNISIQTDTPNDVREWIEDVRQGLEEAIVELIEGGAE